MRTSARKEKAVALPALEDYGRLRCNCVVIVYRLLQVNLDRRRGYVMDCVRPKNRPPVPQVLMGPKI